MTLDINKEIRDNYGLELFGSTDRMANIEEALKNSTVLAKIFLALVAWSNSIKTRPLFFNKEQFARLLNRTKAYVQIYFDQMVDYCILEKVKASPKKVKYKYIAGDNYDEASIGKLVYTAKKTLGGYDG